MKVERLISFLLEDDFDIDPSELQAEVYKEDTVLQRAGFKPDKQVSAQEWFKYVTDRHNDTYRFLATKWKDQNYRLFIQKVTKLGDTAYPDGPVVQYRITPSLERLMELITGFEGIATGL